MSFVKTINNTNGINQIPVDMDTITLRNIAITNSNTQQTALMNTTLVNYDTISLRITAISNSNTFQTALMNTTLANYDTIALRITAINNFLTLLLSQSNIFTGTNSFFNTIVRGSFSRSCLSINASITLPPAILSNYFCINGINPIIITLSSALDPGCSVMIKRGISSSGSITIAYPSIYPFNSNISVSSLLITNSSDFVFFENAWYQKSNF